MFRSRKKSFNEGDSAIRPSMEEVPAMPSGGLGKYSFRRKKNQPEIKKEIDLATALPSQDDFRTSLLMPNLSARFSMLREQDDPTTKVGKASDDSVLFPKRASRLNLFTNAGDLAEIAEVASLSHSIRPPFATERSSTYSNGDGYSTDDDKSLISRSRPGGGNKFFGGRQKIYMLSTKDGEGGSSRAKGRAVYDDDINIEAFKKSGEQNRASEENDEFDPDYSSKRETSSSTNSGNFDSRASTAATSIASASPAATNTGFANKLNSFSTSNADRPNKGKRLYGQGIEQQIHEQQSSALNRLNSIQRNFGPGMVHYGSAPPSRGNATAFKPVQTAVSTSTPTTQSESSTLIGFDFGTTQDTPKDIIIKPFGLVNTGPLSPPMSPTDPTLVAALDANDLGKATATGAFNKPSGPYNDEQFAQRQLQLQQGRETPPIPRAFSRAGTSNTNHTDITRERNGSQASQQSGFSFQSSMARTQPSIREQTSYTQLRGLDIPENASNGTYLSRLSGSDYDSAPTSPGDVAAKSLVQAARAGTLDPAYRHRKYEHDDQHPAWSSRPDSPEEDSPPQLPIQSQNLSSTSLSGNGNENTTGGLSDLVRGHLRNISNQSSVYPDSPPRTSHEEMPEFPAEFARQQAQPAAPIAPSNPLAARARILLENASQLKYNSEEKESQQTPEPSWQDSLNGHDRQASTDTQREREDFANDLADKRKLIQSKLQNQFTANGQYASQRGPDHSPLKDGTRGLLNKASFGSLAKRGDAAKRQGTSEFQDSALQYGGRYRSNSKSAEQLNRMGGGPPLSNGHRNFTAEPRQNYRSQTIPHAGHTDTPPSSNGPSPNPNGHAFPRPHDAPQMSYHPAGRSRKYSPPNASRTPEPGQAPYSRSASAQGQHPQSFRTPSANGSYFPPGGLPSPSIPFRDSPSGSPITPTIPSFLSHDVPDRAYISAPVSRNGSAPNLALQSSNRKGSVSKYEISAPVHVTSTSTIDTVDLPRGLSIDHGDGVGNNHAPPLPPINPRRRGQNFFSPFGKSGQNDSPSEQPTYEEPEEIKTPTTEGADKPRFRNRLRKTSSAGDGLSTRARHQALKEMDKMPRNPVPAPAMNTGMF